MTLRARRPSRALRGGTAADLHYPPCAALRAAPQRAAGGLGAAPCLKSTPCPKETAADLLSRSSSNPTRDPRRPAPRFGEGPVAEDLLPSSIMWGRCLAGTEPATSIADPERSAAATAKERNAQEVQSRARVSSRIQSFPATLSACAEKKLTSRRTWSLHVGVRSRSTTIPAYSAGG